MWVWLRMEYRPTITIIEAVRVMNSRIAVIGFISENTHHTQHGTAHARVFFFFPKRKELLTI